MKLAVVGSRKFSNLEMVVALLETLHKSVADLEIVSGGAEGVDTEAFRWANTHGVPTTVFPADWEQFGNAAGPKRNADIVKASDCGMVFWDGVSPGSLDFLVRAKKMKGYKVVVYL